MKRLVLTCLVAISVTVSLFVSPPHAAGSNSWFNVSAIGSSHAVVNDAEIGTFYLVTAERRNPNGRIYFDDRVNAYFRDKEEATTKTVESLLVKVGELLSKDLLFTSPVWIAAIVGGCIRRRRFESVEPWKFKFAWEATLILLTLLALNLLFICFMPDMDFGRFDLYDVLVGLIVLLGLAVGGLIATIPKIPFL